MPAVVPHGADGVNHPFCGQPVATCDLCLAGPTSAQRAALFQKFRPGRPVNRAIDPAAAEQGRIGGIYQCIHPECGNIALRHLYPRRSHPPHCMGVHPSPQVISQTCRFNDGSMSNIRRQRILVVDDEPLVCESVAMLLSYEGHDVQTAGSAEEALVKHKETEFDVVITDFSMPGMKGDELSRELKDRAPSKPVIMLTAFPPSLPPDT